jgi:hypothetical protein
MKYTGNMLYIYLGVIVINLFNIILLDVVDLDILSSLNNSNSSMEIGNHKIILKISQENSDLLQQGEETKATESNNKVDSADMGDNKDECKEKNLNFLQDIHKRFLFADKSHFPSHFQRNCLPKISEDAVKLYDSQFIKFNKVLSDINNGTEKFYPNEAKPLMETYVDLVAKLSDQQKVMANEAISQLHKLDSKFSRSLYPVDNSGGFGTGTVSGTRSEGAAAGTIER